jgi:transcriptional regulator with AAA-type ATPase domain
VLLGHAAEALASGHVAAVVVDLPTGAKARMYCRPVHGEGRLTGGVVHVKLIEPGSIPATASGAPGRALLLGLPGLIGSGPLWLRGCHQVDAGYDCGEWLALAGEPGVGKLALVRAVHQRRNPAGRFHVLDAAEAAGPDWLDEVRRELLDGEGCLVIRHIDQLNARRLRALSTALRRARDAGRQQALRVVVTVAQGHQSPELTELLRVFSSTVEVPPLRHHIADLHDLVPFFLAKLDQEGRLVCSPEAMQMLLRSSWPGNVEQLWQVLRRVVQHRRTGSIHPNDLPPECRTVSRRLLSPLESLERDAIVQGLVDADGNKVKAAESLGMSRATIYRKIHEYGIVAPTT